MTLDEWKKHPQALTMLEATLQRGVEHLLTHHGWRWHHETDSRKTRAGFLDLNAVRARDGRLLYAELKMQNKYPTPQQRAWLADLQTVPGVSVYVWRPADFLNGDIERALR